MQHTAGLGVSQSSSACVSKCSSSGGATYTGTDVSSSRQDVGVRCRCNDNSFYCIYADKYFIPHHVGTPTCPLPSSGPDGDGRSSKPLLERTDMRTAAFTLVLNEDEFGES